MVDARVDRLEAALARLAEAQAQTQVQLRQLTERVDQLAEAQLRSEQRLAELAQRIDQLAGVVGNMRGDWLEARYARKVPSYFQGLLRGIQAVSGDELERLATEAERRGHLSAAEHADVTDADIVLRGERRDTGARSVLVAEVSAVVDSRDVERAARRARLVERVTNEPALAAVAGEAKTPEADREAQRLGVRRVLDGRVIASALRNRNLSHLEGSPPGRQEHGLPGYVSGGP